MRGLLTLLKGLPFPLAHALLLRPPARGLDLGIDDGGNAPRDARDREGPDRGGARDGCAGEQDWVLRLPRLPRGR